MDAVVYDVIAAPPAVSDKDVSGKLIIIILQKRDID